jgi:hypothetical protein
MSILTIDPLDVMAWASAAIFCTLAAAALFVLVIRIKEYIDDLNY